MKYNYVLYNLSMKSGAFVSHVTIQPICERSNLILKKQTLEINLETHVNFDQRYKLLWAFSISQDGLILIKKMWGKKKSG